MSREPAGCKNGDGALFERSRAGARPVLTRVMGVGELAADEPPAV